MGGVHIGTAPTGPEFAAARPGTWDITGAGAYMLPCSPAPGAKDEAVAILETELLRVGLPGRGGMMEEGDAGKPADGCFTRLGSVAVADDPGMFELVGVGVGVEWEDESDADVLIIDGVWRMFGCVASGPVYFSPSSPGAKVKAEQKPSLELMRSVKPSLDLVLLVFPKSCLETASYHVTSVNVAKCKLLTIQSGFCC